MNLQTYEDDDCCSAELSKAIASGALDTATSWECPECGCEWVAKIVAGGVRHWVPNPLVEILR